MTYRPVGTHFLARQTKCLHWFCATPFERRMISQRPVRTALWSGVLRHVAFESLRFGLIDLDIMCCRRSHVVTVKRWVMFASPSFTFPPQEFNPLGSHMSAQPWSTSPWHSGSNHRIFLLLAPAYYASRFGRLSFSGFSILWPSNARDLIVVSESAHARTPIGKIRCAIREPSFKNEEQRKGVPDECFQRSGGRSRQFPWCGLIFHN